MTAIDRLRAMLDVIAEEARANPKFAKRLEDALKSAGEHRASERAQPPATANEAQPGHPDEVGASRAGEHVASQVQEHRPKRRRSPAVLDPLVVFADGTAELRRRLESLDIEQLKDIVAEFGMDSTQLAMKWKRPERLVDLIVQTAETRARRGDAFAEKRERNS